jgi:hypothetical protein
MLPEAPAHRVESSSMNRETFAIGVLSITATILLVGVLVVVSLPAPAVALGELDRGGDYVMVTSQFMNNWEVVFITDGAVGRMGAYFYNLNTQTILLWDAVELGRFMRRP